MNKTVTVSAYYDTARDSITEPLQFMALSHYYVDRWMPELGANGHMIVTVLRRMGYYERKKGEVREGIEIEQKSLAQLCGISLRTLQREFGNDQDGQPVNPVLHKFIQREKELVRNKAGIIIREKTTYIIQMKDPIHPDDMKRLQTEIERREKKAQDSQGSTERKGDYSPSRQNGGPAASPSRQNGGPGRQNGGPTRQNDGPTRQNGGAYNRENDSDEIEITLETPAAGDSLALLPELGHRPWARLTDAEQAPYVLQAKRELRPMEQDAGPERWARISHHLVESRAGNLYQKEMKKR